MKLKKVLISVTALAVTASAAVSITVVHANTTEKVAGFTEVMINDYDYEVYEDVFADVTAAGDTGEYDGFIYEELEDGTLSIDGYTGDRTDIVIPAEIEGKTVTQIGRGAFRSYVSLKSIVLPNSVIMIRQGAFEGCTFLTVIVIPDSVTSIGPEAFEGCTSLTEVVIPDSVTSIGPEAFEDCTSLIEIVIPDSLTDIGSLVFKGCTSLTSIVVKENNTNFASVDGVLFDKKVTTLVQYPAGRQSTEYTIPDSVTEIKFGAFLQCASLTEIKIPDSVTRIGAVAFSNCTSLTEIVIPDSVTTIEHYTFLNCTSLTKIVIPNSVIEIANVAFDLCPDDLTIYGYAGSYAETYAKENEINFVAITEEDEVFDEDTGIHISAPANVLPAGAELKVVLNDENSTEDSIAYDIIITVNNQPATINGTVTVTMPIPKELESADKYFVFYKDSDNLTDMEAIYNKENNNVTFTTNHFSTYILSTLDLTDTGGAGDPGTPTPAPGGNTGTPTQPTATESTTTEPAATTTTPTSTTPAPTTSATTNEDASPNTGATLLIFPALAAAASVIISKVRK